MSDHPSFHRPDDHDDDRDGFLPDEEYEVIEFGMHNLLVGAFPDPAMVARYRRDDQRSVSVFRTESVPYRPDGNTVPAEVIDGFTGITVAVSNAWFSAAMADFIESGLPDMIAAYNAALWVTVQTAPLVAGSRGATPKIPRE